MNAARQRGCHAHLYPRLRLRAELASRHALTATQLVRERETEGWL